MYDQDWNNGPSDIVSAGGLSPYGTMGQGGNVMEWEETEYYPDTNSASSRRGLRGGPWHHSVIFLAAYRCGGVGPADERFDTGFRVASVVPEPGSITLLVCGLLAGLMRLRRRR